MATELPVLKVFLSCPGDVAPERDVVVDVVQGVNNRHRDECVLSLVYWNMPGAEVPMSATDTPQDSVSRYLCLPRECDLTLVLLWSRIGTPLPADKCRADGSPFESGTVWELEDAESAGKEVFVYRCRRKVSVDMDDPAKAEKEAQYEKLKTYFNRFESEDGSLPRGINAFETMEAFQRLMDSHLENFIGRWRGNGTSHSAATDGAVSPRFGRANPDREHLKRLLRLCDHDDWVRPIAESIRRCREDGSRYAIGCLLPGQQDRGHDDLVDRIHDSAIADHIGDLQPDEIMLLKINVPLEYDSKQAFENSLLYGLQKSAAELSGARNLADVIGRLRKFDKKVVLAYAYYDMDGNAAVRERERHARGREERLKGVFVDFLRDVPVDAGPLTLFFAIGLKYADPTAARPGWMRSLTRWLASMEAAAVPRWTKDECERYRAAQPPLLLLDPLPLIRRTDVVRWRDDRRVREALDATILAERLAVVVDKLFDQQDAWPLPRLGEALVKDLNL